MSNEATPLDGEHGFNSSSDLTTTPGATVRRKRAALALIASVVLVALGSWGDRNPQNFVLVETLFGHEYVLDVVAVLLAGWGLGLLTRRKWLRQLLWIPTVLVGCLWALLGVAFAQTFGWTDVVAVVPAPDSHYEAVVTLTAADLPDPAWIISIRQTGSLTAREVEIGCISGDDPQYGFRNATWADPEHLTLKLNSHTLTVRVDPATGKPAPVSGHAWHC